MSKPLSLSATFCAFIMALFALTGNVTVPAHANGATAGAIAPLTAFEVSR